MRLLAATNRIRAVGSALILKTIFALVAGMNVTAITPANVSVV